MTDGRFIAVVGPSGVGKDSIIEALCDVLPSAVRCRRTITRAAEAGGEDHEAVDVDTFHARAERGDFLLWWRAHGLSYGIPLSVRADLTSGRDVIANLSRGKLAEANDLFERFVVLSISADEAVLAQRLATRGRESAEDRTKRLARAHLAVPNGLRVIEIDNSGKLEDAVAHAIEVLQSPSG